LLVFESDSNYFLSSEKSLLQVNRIYDFLKHKSSWAHQRTLEEIITGIDHSYCIGIYYNDTWSAFTIESQIGFARVVTDFTSFALLCDVYIEEFHRHRGLASWMLKYVFDSSSFKNIHTWLVEEGSDSPLYTRLGFLPLQSPNHWKEKTASKENKEQQNLTTSQ